MTYRINFDKYASHFSVPAELAGQDLATVEGDYLKVILLILRNSDRNYSESLLSSLLNLSESRVEDALKYWIEAGILREQESTPIRPDVITLSRHTAQAPPPIRPAPGSELAFLLECMENLLCRPVTSVEYKSVAHILEFIRLPADVVLMAIEHCVTIGKMNARYLEKVCVSWADNGITTHELAEQYLNYMKQSRQLEASVQKLFGIENRSLIDSERECIHRWGSEYHCDLEMIRLAYEKTVGAIGKLSFPYLNKILQSWNEKGYSSADEVLAGEGQGGKRPARAAAASYDLAELERYWDTVPKLK